MSERTHTCFSCVYEPDWIHGLFRTAVGNCKCPVQVSPWPDCLIQTEVYVDGQMIWASQKQLKQITECAAWKAKGGYR